MTPTPEEKAEVGAKPLAGKRVIVTRAHDQSAGMLQLLRDAGAEAISIPTIEIKPPQSFQPLDRALKQVPGYNWLLLTSVNGVKALERRMRAGDVDVGLMRHLSVCAIGPATREEAERIGLKVTVVPEEYVAESVVAALREQVAGKRVLLVRAKVARDVIPAELRRAGAEVDVAEAYQTVAPANSAARLRAELVEAERKPDVITFTSSSTVSNFIALLGKNVSLKSALEGVELASIGPVTSRTLREAGLKASIEAKQFTVPGLVEAISRHYANLADDSPGKNKAARRPL